ncbi:MAG: EI24 domain-containing protein [Crocinitomicaceae bacterium]
MGFLKNLFFGYKAYFKAIKFIREHKLYWYFAIPAILMLGIYGLGDMVQHHKIEPDVHDMNEIVWYLIFLLIEISIALLLMNFAKYLVVVILSPVLASLSMKTEKILTSNKYQFNLSQLISDIKRAIHIAIRNLIWFYLLFLVIYIVCYLGWEDPKKSPVFYLTFMIGFFYYGFGFLDYINERRRLDMDQSIMFVRKNRGLAIAIGSIYSIMILVPVDLSALFYWSNFSDAPMETIGRFFLHLLLWLCASIAPILAIIAATIAMNDLVDLSKNEYAQKQSE